MQAFIYSFIGTNENQCKQNYLKRWWNLILSPCILCIALSLYIGSLVGYKEFKNSTLEVFPSIWTLQRMKLKMMQEDGISQNAYQWFYDEVVSCMPMKEGRGHLMYDEMHLKSGVYWNTQSHKLVGFASDTSDLNLLDELRALENINDDNARGSIDQLDEYNADAKKVNQ